MGSIVNNCYLNVWPRCCGRSSSFGAIKKMHMHLPKTQFPHPAEVNAPIHPIRRIHQSVNQRVQIVVGVDVLCVWGPESTRAALLIAFHHSSNHQPRVGNRSLKGFEEGGGGW